MKNSISVLVLFIIIAFVACKQDVKSTLIGKKIVFPDSLITIRDGEFFSYKQKIGDYILVVPLSGECPACTKSIKEWGGISNLLKEKFKIQSIFIMDIHDTLAFKKMIYPNLPKNIQYVLNIDYCFQMNNNIMVAETRFHGLLLNPENVIVHNSNILFDGSNVDAYLKDIEGIIKQNGYPK